VRLGLFPPRVDKGNRRRRLRASHGREGRVLYAAKKHGLENISTEEVAALADWDRKAVRRVVLLPGVAPALGGSAAGHQGVCLVCCLLSIACCLLLAAVTASTGSGFGWRYTDARGGRYLCVVAVLRFPLLDRP
jgi:hypothetical protein